VSSNQITAKGCELIASKNLLLNLKIVDLSNNKIGNVGFESIIKSTRFPNVIDLRLDMNKIDETK
jgi:hypothetical protein